MNGQLIWITSWWVFGVPSVSQMVPLYPTMTYPCFQVYFIDDNASSFQAQGNLSGITLYTDFRYFINLPMHHQFVRIATDLVQGKCNDLGNEPNCKGDIFNSHDKPGVTAWSP
jgi:hypothetical protein